MEVNLSPEIEAKLNRTAAEQGRDHDEWFIREVKEGLAAADRGEFVEHDEAGNLIQSRYRG